MPLFQAARPPEEVKAAFDDAIAARENEQQYIREAEAYTNEVQPPYIFFTLASFFLSDSMASEEE